MRGTIGYRRYTSPAAANLLESIHADLHTCVNLFQPVHKLVEKRCDGAKIYKRYDSAQTHYQRTMADQSVTALRKAWLQQAYRQLNPAQLRRQIDAKLKRLWQLPE